MNPDTHIEQILNSPSLTRSQKVAALRQLAYDARENAVAAEEGMSGKDAQDGADLAAIHAALRQLGESDDSPDASKH